MSEKKKRGFAAISAEQRSAIASKGGKAAHALGKAHEFTTETARAAGAKGGRATHQNRKQQRTPDPDPNNGAEVNEFGEVKS